MTSDYEGTVFLSQAKDGTITTVWTGPRGWVRVATELVDWFVDQHNRLVKVRALLAWWDSDGDIEFEDFIGHLRGIVKKDA